MQELQDEDRKAILTKAHGAIYEAEKIITRVDVEGLAKVDTSIGDVAKSLEEQCSKLRDALTKEEEDLDEISQISQEVVDVSISVCIRPLHVLTSFNRQPRMPCPSTKNSKTR